jgi:hypothetical protein
MRPSRLALAGVVSVTAAVTAAAGCGGASPASGLTAFLRASNAQYVPGTLDAVTAVAGPKVDSVRTNSSTAFPGEQGRAIAGSLSGTATAVLVGLAADSGYWVIPAGIMDTETPGDFAFQTTLSFSPELPVGDATLIFRATDGEGQVGPANLLPLLVSAPAPSGALVVSLEWDTESDLDLHVLIPNVNDPNAPYEVWARNPVALPPRGPSDPPTTAADVDAAGHLDFDSNAACVIDGRRQENLVFANPPPPGAYEVRVDTSSLCGQATARWHALAVAGGGNATLGEAFGQVTDAATSGSHIASSGLLAFTFSIP